MHLRIAGELLVFAGVLVADAQGHVPLTLTIGLLPAVVLLHVLSREPASTIGLKRPSSPWRALVLGVVLGLAMEVLALRVTTPLLARWFGAGPDYGELNALRGDLGTTLLVILLGWILAAFGEELCFRGFLMDRVARVLGAGRVAWGLSLVLVSVLFGSMHSEQGMAGAVQEGLSGFWLGLVYLCARRELLLPVVAHGVSNTLAFVLLYLGRYP